MNSIFLNKERFDEREKSKGLLSSIAIFLFLAIFIPAFSLYLIDGSFTLACGIQLLILMACSVRLSILGYYGEKRLSMMTFYVFIYVWMGVLPLISIYTSRYPNGIHLSSDIETLASTSVFLSIIFFEIGYLGFKRSRKKIVEKLTEKTKYLLNREMVTFLLILSVVIFFVVIFVLGSADLFFANRSAEGSALESISQTLFYRTLVRTTAGATLLLALYYVKERGTFFSWKKWSSFTFVIIAIVLFNGIVSNPLNAPRLWFGSLVLAAVLINLKWKKTTMKRLYMLLIIFCLTMFSAFDPRDVIVPMDRAGQQIEPTSVAVGFYDNGVRNLEEIARNGDFDAYAMTGVVIHYVSYHDYAFGRQLLLPAFFYVPRSMWSSKPEGTAYVVASHGGLISANASCPLWAEGYMNFGWLGVILFLLILGRVAAFFDAIQCEEESHNRRGFAFIGGCFFSANMFILLRGDLNTGLMYLNILLFTTFCVFKFMEIHAQVPSRDIPQKQY